MLSKHLLYAHKYPFFVPTLLAETVTILEIIRTSKLIAVKNMQRLDDPHTIRVCNVAGKFLVFDLESVALLRRELRTSGVLAGTTPQQPTQNMFLGLPVELDRIEAEALVRCICRRNDPKLVRQNFAPAKTQGVFATSRQ
ncbi:tRNA-splicing endonuclease subunit sen34 [Ophiocordyceps camponoti-floridani]|uniref:tRNA-splicing endonuclease subunit sen34 n=1 Tax=Ophiocordyceps camponoti-floridani TaxID=2030778 RepID=A0A8H4Q3T5_9HYPO|nr:tRNA-splicing endonuclease subunit sen34 [Ophiocordyceps camponoti-floridani]